jgi:hypothetical protein
MTTPEYKFGGEMVQADASADGSSVKFTNAVEQGTDRERLGELFHSLSYLMKAGHWKALDAFFADQRLGDPPIFIVGALRFCSPVRERLPEWKKLIGMYYETLKARGENPDWILRGLISNDSSIPMNLSNESERTDVSLNQTSPLPPPPSIEGK